jgi:hypothetical protein
MRIPRDNADALNAFIAQKAAIDATLAGMIALSAEHFNCAPDAITRSDVATLGG